MRPRPRRVQMMLGRPETKLGEGPYKMGLIKKQVSARAWE